MKIMTNDLFHKIQRDRVIMSPNTGKYKLVRAHTHTHTHTCMCVHMQEWEGGLTANTLALSLLLLTKSQNGHILVSNLLLDMDLRWSEYACQMCLVDECSFAIW
jgi:hypothetical protein